MTHRLSAIEIERLEQGVAEAGDKEQHGTLMRLLAELKALRSDNEHAWKVCDERCRERDKAERDRDELQATLDLEWKANRRGIDEWQQATGKTMSWPDQAGLVAFVLKERDQALARVKELEALFDHQAETNGELNAELVELRHQLAELRASIPQRPAGPGKEVHP